ncbi:hypothetical protein Cch01nite_27520 [Cellulomonas chitinilytica]|uniref:Uncharacterized protein n=1 Tax=Cellulomonas chitinilytica TaxID=398759 RepID=A0A919U0J2_9CELL|nr:hypothetical protein [Cellulomonas chitinilytica]GIG22028.1 hypothetical protein Cch01nite_27520 [Cellulomonas chitinilytica]
MRRRASALPPVGAVVVGCLALSGCTVEGGAIAGVGVDDQGRPVGYLQVCEGHIDGATVYHSVEPDPDADSVSNPSVSDGSWDAPSAVSESATWSLAAPDDWRTQTPLSPLEPGVEYSLYGWTNDNSWSAIDVPFTVDDLAGMEPGQVRYEAWTDDGELGDWAPVVTDVDEFVRDACASLT